MASRAYDLFREAILAEKQVTCIYDGYPREVCPLILGRKKGEEKVLAFQFGGRTSKGPVTTGQWKCLTLTKVRNPAMRDGPWYEGGEHRAEQRCVDEVDLDINIHVRKRRRNPR